MGNYSKKDQMKITTLNYSESIETIQPNGLKKWVGLDIKAELEEGEEDKAATIELKKRLDENIKAANPWINVFINPSITDFNTGKSITAPIPDIQVDKRIPVLIEDINNCTVLDKKNSLGVQVGLVAYYDMVQGNEELKAAYELRKSQLVKIESESIIERTEALIKDKQS